MNSPLFYFYLNDITYLVMSDLPPELYEAYKIAKPFINWEKLGLPRSNSMNCASIHWSSTSIPAIRSSYFLTHFGYIGDMGEKFHQYILNNSSLSIVENSRNLNFYDRFLIRLKPYIYSAFVEIKPLLIVLADTYILVVETPYQLAAHTFNAVDSELGYFNTIVDNLVEFYNLTYYSVTRGNLPPPSYHFNSAYGGCRYPMYFDDLLKYRIRNFIDGYDHSASRYATYPAQPIFKGSNWSLQPIYDTSHYFSRTTVPYDLIRYSNGNKVNTIGIAFNYCIESQNNIQVYCGLYFTPDFPTPRSSKLGIGICFDSSCFTRISYTREYLPRY